MKIRDLVFDIIVEEVKNKKLFNAVIDKWSNEYPELKSDNEEIRQKALKNAEEVFLRHEQVKTNLSEKNPIVYGFLIRHDGTDPNLVKYTINDLKQIEKIKLKDLVTFLRELVNFETEIFSTTKNDKEKNEEELSKIFEDKGNNKTPEKIEASKQMWYDTSSAMINEDGFRVYKIMNQPQSIRMGYYYQYLHRKVYQKEKGNHIVNPPWCVTWRGSDVTEFPEDENGNRIPGSAPLFSHSNNLYYSYRKNHGFTFYFVIDENRGPEDRYHMSSLVATKTGFILTSMFNDGDNSMSWDQIVKIYPKLDGHRDKIQYRAPSEDEISSLSIVDIINENENDPQHEFARQSLDTKLQYITAGGSIKKVKSWMSMPNNLRQSYIESTGLDNVFTKFSTLELIEAVFKEGFYDKLDRRLKILGKSGVDYLVQEILKRKYETHYISKENREFSIFKSKDTGKFGIYVKKQLKWLVKNNIEYKDDYNIIEHRIYLDKEGEMHLVELYSKTNTTDDTSFVSVTKPSESTDYTSILTYNSFVNHVEGKLLTRKEDDTDPDEPEGGFTGGFDDNAIDVKEYKQVTSF